MWYGAAYYPEHWPRKRWAKDARMMCQAGFNVARLAEFAWCKIEPEPDRFEFDWLDAAIETLYGKGISILLGTPTAGPPAWLVNAKESDCRMVYENDSRWEVGGRSLCCVNHPHFIERSRRIAEAMGKHYAGHPALMGWQLDNELGMYGTRCYCDRCAEKFRKWLRDKYGGIETLNRRLGMVFGGGEFGSFDDIPIPRFGQDLHNHGLLLDSQRFFSDSNAAYLKTQVKALRGAGVRQPITHNVCHMFGSGMALDNCSLFENLDVVGWDCYPQQFDANPEPATLGLLHAIARGYKNDGRFWMLEQQSGSPFGMPADDPRRIRLWAWESIAHGAEMILYFRWRTCRFGGEQYWRGILGHEGAENERYSIILKMGEELRRAEEALQGTTRTNECAILLDFDSCESFRITRGTGGPSLRYRDYAESFFDALRKRGYSADIIYEPPEPGSYRLVIAPGLRMVDSSWTDRLHDFVHSGGMLITGICAATLDRDHVVPAEPLPWSMTDVFGLQRFEWSALGPLSVMPKERLAEEPDALEKLSGPDSVLIAADAGALKGVYGAGVWCDHLRTTTAKTLARFTSGLTIGGLPAVTLNSFGAGKAVYVASVLQQDFIDKLIEFLTPSPEIPVSADSKLVEVVRCISHGRCLFFLLNHSSRPETVLVPRGARELLHQTEPEGRLVLEPYDVALITV